MAFCLAIKMVPKIRVLTNFFQERKIDFGFVVNIKVVVLEFYLEKYYDKDAN